MKSTIEHWDQKYELPPDRIPWEISAPPYDLLVLLEYCSISEGKQALDIACGTGNYSRFLASRGYHVTALDFSSRALAVARSRAEPSAMPIEYIEADVTRLSAVLAAKRQFDLVLDYSLIHHLPPDDFHRHARQFASRLTPTGKLLVVCYSDTDPYAQGQSRARGAFGNEMFYRTRASVEEAYAPLRAISYRETTLGKQNHHSGHSFVFVR